MRIPREDFMRPEVDAALAHQKALLRQSRATEIQPISPLRRVLLSSLFYRPLAGVIGAVIAWLIYEPFYSDDEISPLAAAEEFFLIVVHSAMVALSIFIVEGMASRRIFSNIGRWMAGVGLAIVFSILGLIISGFIMMPLPLLIKSVEDPTILVDIRMWPPHLFVGFIIMRTLAWTALGAGLGLGISIYRGVRSHIQASVLGGAAGGALGGVLFDPINRFVLWDALDGDIMRLTGFGVMGLCVGLFIAIGEQLGREAWVRVRTGPLAGKSFILYRNPTIIGSSPQSDIYLFKDKDISPIHAAIHRSGGACEIEDLESQNGVFVENRRVRRCRLSSGDQISIGATVIEFEEHSKRKALDQTIIQEVHP
jgi:FHA domain-containing protein